MGYEWDIPYTHQRWLGNMSFGILRKENMLAQYQKKLCSCTSPCLPLKSPLYHLIPRSYPNIPAIFHHVKSNHPKKS